MDSITLVIKAISENISLSRTLVAAYAARCNPSFEIINDVKTAVSEAVTNAVIHAYNGDFDKEVSINAHIIDNILSVSVTDCGVGIADVEKATQGFYTTRQDDECVGLGFTIMKTFMDTLEVKSTLGTGVSVIMTKRLSNGKCEE
ncbi:MAG: anti-sigma F factor [Christensenellaceae bacterium]|jgi:stage II sporulation protein AB (anti-sigma F factor)|nr:anti-sigma F factor [Christensenellaceae bacterium]